MLERRLFLKSAFALTAAGLVPWRSVTAADSPTQVAKNAAAIEKSPLGTAIKIARLSVSKFDTIDDYEAVFIKRERFGNDLQETPMRVKVRHEPFSVYMKFGQPHEGREVLFVDGRNNGKLQVHDSGIKSIVGTISLDVEHRRVMDENHYPITRFGMQKMVETLISQWEVDALIPGVEVKYFREAKVGSVSCKAIESRHPKPVRGAKFHISRLYIDAATNLPVRTQQFSFPSQAGAEPQLFEEYTYLDVKTNLGMTDVDFSTDNDNYNF